ncbi:hypothetical protein ROA7450_00452 [Roseovarius albus]|uniref:DUF3137 domain-containing protein n=1 Tax=Roseovarius albus TaxID=1247867 RepID=A0A1X6YBZ7_9RHOB|nr:hypothetical protein [Roseovarius albus]SLN16655.1 hypothetical protein ROA7450_00452 [Roseovarius albus]
MNISNQIQIIYIPWWIRVAIAVIMLSSISICGYLFYWALVDGEKANWLAAGTYLLGIVFPILIIVIVIAGASFGELSILRRTEKMLVRTIPYHLQFIPEETRNFVEFRNYTRSAKTKSTELANISLFHSTGRCYADYVIRVPSPAGTLKLNLRVEMNIKRVNINVAFLRTDLDDLMQLEGISGNLEDFLRNKFQHSLAIEALQSEGAKHASTSDGTVISYAFNKSFLSREVDGQDYVVVVATTGVPYDTVWNPSERVFFAQDLMFMIRAFMQESPDVFLDRSIEVNQSPAECEPTNKSTD